MHEGNRTDEDGVSNVCKRIVWQICFGYDLGRKRGSAARCRGECFIFEYVYINDTPYIFQSKAIELMNKFPDIFNGQVS